MLARAGLEDFCSAGGAEERRARVERELGALAAHECAIHAFVCHDAQRALEQVDRNEAGPLSGALIGVKDIITTSQFPTRYGLPSTDATCDVDAWCVARARRLGGIILGKTVCTAFGVALPGPTVNPRDPRRTPGGSSSGSAAAVAAGFVSFALGSQTAGSTIRPASYCGVTGYKPTFGLLPTVGMAALSTTLDHLGIFARSPRDAWYFASALALAREEKLAARKPKRLLILRVPAEIGIGDDYPARLEELASCVTWDGVEVETLDLPFAFDDFALLQKRLCYWEAARLLPASAQFRLTAEQWAAFGSYLDVDVSLYANARLQQGSCQAKFQQLAISYDAVLMPAATGAAPPTLGNTGDAVMNRFWTALHVPVLSVPMWVTEDGAPLGLQVIGALGDDRSLCEIAQWFFEEHAADPVGQ